MLIPEAIRKCVAFIHYKKASADPPKTAGTVFFAAVMDAESDEGVGYAVTARHVIEYIAKDSVDDKVLLRMNFRGSAPQFLETKVSDWTFHPTDETVDVAVLPISLPPESDHFMYSLTPNNMITDEVITKEGIGPGDEVFITGLFRSHYGNQRNIPIVRVGNIAAMSEELIKTNWHDRSIEAYLIEARSISGLSGSPAFVHLGPVRVAMDGIPKYATKPSGVHYFMGIVHGHWDISVPDTDAVIEDGMHYTKINAGIAIVVPSSKIVDVLNQPKLAEPRLRLFEESRKKRRATPDHG